MDKERYVMPSSHSWAKSIIALSSLFRGLHYVAWNTGRTGKAFGRVIILVFKFDLGDFARQYQLYIQMIVIS